MLPAGNVRRAPAAQAPHRDVVAVTPGSRPSGNRSGRLSLFGAPEFNSEPASFRKRNGLQNRFQGVRLLPPVLDVAHCSNGRVFIDNSTAEQTHHARPGPRPRRGPRRATGARETANPPDLGSGHTAFDSRAPDDRHLPLKLTWTEHPSRKREVLGSRPRRGSTPIPVGVVGSTPGFESGRPGSSPGPGARPTRCPLVQIGTDAGL
jgi:hypothetical protein